MAAQGSSPAPVLPDSRLRRSACGWRRVPFLPMNSLRSPVMVRVGALVSNHATCPEKSVLKLLRASNAPVSGSVSVTTCMEDLARRSPSTHST
ncbi:hypothetical protein D3C81_1802770 [compost metagenome]